MSRLQLIENQLNAVNGAKFQELCDVILQRKFDDYTAFGRTGSMAGKQKTKKGTPDSFMKLDNGNYRYVEITTDTSTNDKLSNDIKACFNEKKTGILKEKIEEIVLCFNWEIKQDQIDQLEKLAKGYNPNARVTCLMLKELAIEIHYNHRDLANLHLGIPLDTGQIVSVDVFIKEYEKVSMGIATPLTNPFQHGKKETEELLKTLEDSDLVILTGSPGVGKTKLSLETIRMFVQKHGSYQAFAVSPKNHDLLENDPSDFKWSYKWWDKQNAYW